MMDVKAMSHGQQLSSHVWKMELRKNSQRYVTNNIKKKYKNDDISMFDMSIYKT